MGCFYPYGTKKEPDNAFQRFKNMLKDWSRNDTIQLGLLIVAAVYAVITWGLLSLTREQVHTGQRAYLVFHHPVLDNPLAINSSTQITIDLLNSGQTPAKDVHAIAVANIFSSFPNTINYGALIPMGAVGANQTMKLGAATPLLQSSDFDDVIADPLIFGANSITMTNRPKLYILAKAQYADVFGGSGEAEFCAVYWASKKIFTSCFSHNEIK
jgi:hypothetical protein